jgi:hypothetical protein
VRGVFAAEGSSVVRKMCFCGQNPAQVVDGLKRLSDCDVKLRDYVGKFSTGHQPGPTYPVLRKTMIVFLLRSCCGIHTG